MDTILHQWTYRNLLLVTPLPAGLTDEEVELELDARRATIDEELDMAELVGEEL